jgi:hypothetical protein
MAIYQSLQTNRKTDPLTFRLNLIKEVIEIVTEKLSISPDNDQILTEFMQAGSKTSHFEMH